MITKKYSVSILLICLLTSINLKALDFFQFNNEIINNCNLYESQYISTATAPVLSLNKKTNTTVKLSWTASSDDAGIIGYKVYKNDVLVVTLGNVLHYEVTDLLASTQYNFTVTAINSLANESVPSNILKVTTNNASARQSKFY